MTRWPGIALLLLASTLPSLFALDSPWLWDDVAIVRDATSFDELRELPRAWTSELWTDRRPGPPLYRPVPRMLWTLQTIAGDGDPLVFRAVSIALYGLVTVLLFFYLRQHFPRRVAFTASLLFALFPIHTEVVVLAVGQAELLAAAFGIAALLMWKRRQNAVALTLFALAVLSKESAAAIAILGWLEAPRPRKRALTAGVIAVAIVGAATWIRLAVDSGPPSSLPSTIRRLSFPTSPEP